MKRNIAIWLCAFGICFSSYTVAEDTEKEEEETVSTEAPVPSKPVDLPPRARWDDERFHQLALSDESRQRELTWLDVQYPEAESTYQMLALEKKARVRAVQGAVLLAHDYGHHANWPEVIRPLRNILTHDGWYTLSINMPIPQGSVSLGRDLDPKVADEIVVTEALQAGLLKSQTTSMKRLTRDLEEESAPDATEDISETMEGADSTENEAGEAPPENSDSAEELADQSADENAEEESVDIDLGAPKPLPHKRWSYQERALAHLVAGFDRIKASGFENIVLIAHGAAAQTALEFIEPRAANLNETGFALIMIDPRLDLPYSEDLGASLGERFKPPVLDLYDHSQLVKRESAEQRQIAARLSAIRSFTQIKLRSSDVGLLEETLLRRVRNWMLVQAPGMEASKLR